MKRVLSCLFVGSLVALSGVYASSEDDFVFSGASRRAGLLSSEAEICQKLSQVIEGNLSYTLLRDAADLEFPVPGKVLAMNSFLESSIQSLLHLMKALKGYDEGNLDLLLRALGEIQDFVKQVNKGSLADRLRRANSGYAKIRELLLKFSEGCRNVAEGGSVEAAFVQEITDLIQGAH